MLLSKGSEDALSAAEGFSEREETEVTADASFLVFKASAPSLPPSAGSVVDSLEDNDALSLAGCSGGTRAAGTTVLQSCIYL